MRFILTIMIILCFIIPSVTQTAISAQDPFSEDWSSGNLDEWTAFAWKDHSIPLNHTYTIQNGSLISSGTSLKFNTINYICQKTEYDNGTYKFDLFIPTEGDLVRFGFRVSVFPPPSELDPDKYEERPSLVQTVITKDPAVLIGQHDHGDSSFTNLANEPVSEDDIRGWHTYEMRKNSTHISVFLDGEFITTAKIIQSKVAPYDSICMWTDVGSGIKVDNISVMTLPDTENNTISEDVEFPQMIFITLLTPVIMVVLRSSKSRTKSRL